MFILAQSGPVDPREWMQWALDRGVQGVLILGCFILLAMVIRLYRREIQLHKERAKLEEDYRNAQAQQSEAFRKRVGELENEFRSKVEQLLREQVKIAKETTQVLVRATKVLDSLDVISDQPPSEKSR